jgi:hypothetical protein
MFTKTELGEYIFAEANLSDSNHSCRYLPQTEYETKFKWKRAQSSEGNQ